MRNAIVSSVLVSLVLLFAGRATAGTLTATVLYNGQPLQGAYVYLQNSAQPLLEQNYQSVACQASNPSACIYGPSDASGNISVNAAAGVYYVRLIKRANACPYNYCSGNYGLLGPPYAGDYTWHSSGTVAIPASGTVSLGTVNATVYGQPVTITGTVRGASGKALAGWAVKAATVPCESGNWAYAHSFNECGTSKHPAWTDANGNYAITLMNTGTYYVYASPNLNYANTNYPGGYPTCTTAVGCEDCGDYYYYNCPTNVVSPGAPGVNIVVPGY